MPVVPCESPVGAPYILHLAPALPTAQSLSFRNPGSGSNDSVASRQFPPKIHDQYKAMLGSDCPWNEMERWSFYDEIKSPEESSRRC